MNYKAIALDLDGTLLNSKNQISDNTKNALIKIQQMGIKVILASGRPTHGIVKASKILELDKFGGYILSYNGGQIIDVKRNKLIFNTFLEKDMILELYAQSRKLETNIITYTDQYILTEDDDEYIQLESRINDLPVVRVPDLTKEIKTSSVKCLMTGDPIHIAQVEETLKKTYTDLSFYRSMPFFLECMPKGIDKGNSLKILLRHLGININTLISCGDGYNDISLVEVAGLGVAMENGCAPIKALANYITHSNDDDGIVHVIEKFMMQKK